MKLRLCWFRNRVCFPHESPLVRFSDLVCESFASQVPFPGMHKDMHIISTHFDSRILYYIVLYIAHSYCLKLRQGGSAIVRDCCVLVRVTSLPCAPVRIQVCWSLWCVPVSVHQRTELRSLSTFLVLLLIRLVMWCGVSTGCRLEGAEAGPGQVAVDAAVQGPPADLAL